MKMKWNESGFRPPLCTYRLNWARRTSWGWWDDWDDTVLQTQDSKLEPWRSEAEHATSRSRRLPTILTFTRGWGRNILVSLTPPRPGTEPRTLAWKAAVLTTTLGPPPIIFSYVSIGMVVCNHCPEPSRTRRPAAVRETGTQSVHPQPNTQVACRSGQKKKGETAEIPQFENKKHYVILCDTFRAKGTYKLYHNKWFFFFNPLTAKLFNLNFHPL